MIKNNDISKLDNKIITYDDFLNTCTKEYKEKKYTNITKKLYESLINENIEFSNINNIEKRRYLIQGE